MRAGRQPGEALLRAARDSGGLGDGAGRRCWRRRGSAGTCPGRSPGRPGNRAPEGLLGLAACWRVAVDQGAGLAAGLDRLEGALRAERDQRADLRAQLAGAAVDGGDARRPAGAGPVLGTALGADPLHVLLHTGAGLGCLLVGGVLEGVGLWWALRIVRGAEVA